MSSLLVPNCKPPATSNQLSPVPTSGGSAQELTTRAKLMRSALLTLLQDTDWPNKSEDAAQKLVQTINSVPDFPRDVTLVNDIVQELIRVVDTAYASLKEASDRYGRKQGGFMDGIKHAIPSRRRQKWTDVLQTCRADIETISTTLRSRLESLAPVGSVQDAAIPSGFQNQPTSTPNDVSHSLEPLEPQGLQTSFPEQANTLEHPTGQQTSVQDSAADLPEDLEKRSPIRDGALTALRKTFKTVDAISGAIPAVGSYVGAAAKVGLAFVSMIETMDKNKSVAEDLASQTSKLSEYLERFRGKSGTEPELAAHVRNLHRELESIQKKVSKWDSLGRFERAVLASDHAEELKGHRYTAQTLLEEIQLLVSLKTSDLVSELENRELRAERRRLLDRLGDGSYGARGYSIEDVGCLPGTRVEILDRIDHWIKDTSSSAERVLWIRGMAGRGKSAIASTVANRWASKGSCAIFHFRRGQNASDGQFICALVRQLGKGLVPEVRNAILECVRENEDIATERLDKQFETLLVGPLDKLKDHTHPIIIIVDALDECEKVTDAVRFVRLIDRHSSSLFTNVKFLLTCRPEAPLLEALEPRKWYAEDLDSISLVSEDITLFILHSFAQIREDRGLPGNWPSSTDIECMVEMSQGLFQWARTAITYVGDRSPVHRLRGLLQHSSTWGQLDYLYSQILLKAFEEAGKHSMRRQLLCWVLETLVAAPYPVSLEVVAFLHADHEIFEGQEDTVQFLRNDILADLNSLLHIPTSPGEPLRLMHTSIRDLLVAQERCENKHYFVDLFRAHRRLANVSLGIMGRGLRKNICNLSDISKVNSEVQDAVESHVPQGLRYCCRSWSIHLITGIPWSEINGVVASETLSKFKLVWEDKLLAWLEVMSLIGATDEALATAKQVHQWLLRSPHEMSVGDLITLWNDTKRFIASCWEPISFSALQIYASALPHCPVETNLWKKYGDQATTRILRGKRQLHWPANIWASPINSSASKIEFSKDGGVLICVLANGTVQLLDAQTGASVGNPLTGLWDQIRPVVFLLDGMVLAAVPDGTTIRLWDARTGVQLGNPLTGHTQWITSVVVSPDSRVLASASDDNTVRVWDARTGAQLSEPLAGHTQSISSVAFSPDGKVLASVSLDMTVRLWDARTGAQLSDPLTGHTQAITSAVFSPDSKILASASDDSTVRLWNARTGVQLGDPLTGHTEWITTVVFSSDSMILASVSADNTVRLWDTRTGAQLGDPLTSHVEWITSVAFSPDGKILASGSYDKTVRLWDARIGAPFGDSLTGHTDAITSVVFSPDGKVLASVSNDKTVRLWNALTRAQLGDPLTGHAGKISSAVFSPDGNVLATLRDDKTVRLWDAWIGAQLGDPLTGHTDQAWSVVFSPDGKVLASVSEDKTVRLWDARTGAQLGDPLTGHTDQVWSVVFSPDGKVLASVSEDKTVRLWDAWTGAQLGDPLTGHTDRVWSVVFSPDGKVLASVSKDKTVRLWDAWTGAQLGDPLTGHTEWVWSVVFSPDGKVLASVSKDKTVRLWDAWTGAQLGDPLTGQFVVFSPDGKVLAYVSEDKTVRLWDAWTGAQLGDPLTGHTDQLWSVAFSPDGKVLASVEDKTVRLWDAWTGAQLGDPLTGHTDQVWSVVFSPDGKVLASVSKDKTVRLWDAWTGAQLGDPLTGHTAWVWSVVFSLDGKVLASVSKDKTVRLWDAWTGAQLGDPLTGHTDQVWSVAFSPDGKVLASVSEDKTVRLWDAWTGAQLGDPLSGGKIRSVVFSPDGKALASNLGNGAVRLWDQLTCQISDGSFKDSPVTYLSYDSNWILWDSMRVLWLPVHYRSVKSPTIYFSHKTLVLLSDATSFIIAVDEFLNL